MTAWLDYWWHRCVDYYHVNPVIFLSLYVPKSFIYWWTIFRILAHLRKGETGRVPALILLNVTTNLSPWLYVYFCGDNLPWFYPLWFVAMIGFAFFVLYRTVKKKLTTPPSKEELELDDERI